MLADNVWGDQLPASHFPQPQSQSGLSFSLTWAITVPLTRYFRLFHLNSICHSFIQEILIGIFYAMAQFWVLEIQPRTDKEPFLMELTLPCGKKLNKVMWKAVIGQSPTKGWVVKEACLRRFEPIHEIQELSIQRLAGTTSTKTLRPEQVSYFLKREDQCRLSIVGEKSNMRWAQKRSQGPKHPPANLWSIG